VLAEALRAALAQLFALGPNELLLTATASSMRRK
jgi:hypothetical protein